MSNPESFELRIRGRPGLAVPQRAFVPPSRGGDATASSSRTRYDPDQTSHVFEYSGRYVRALTNHPYSHADPPGELSFQRGDTITVVGDDVNEGRWQGQLDEHTGSFRLDQMELIPTMTEYLADRKAVSNNVAGKTCNALVSGSQHTTNPSHTQTTKHLGWRRYVSVSRPGMMTI
jgi:hypothetical protein